MDKPKYRSALIVGTGPGLSASLARLFAKNGLTVDLAARRTDKLSALAKETGAAVHTCNAADPGDVAALFGVLDAAGRTPDVVVYNASNRVRAPLVELAPEDVKRAIEISAFGAFLVSQQAVKRMLPPWMNLYAILTMATTLISVVGIQDGLTITRAALVAESRPELMLPMYLLLLLMFSGRVGVITLAVALAARSHRSLIRYPEEKPLVG